MYIAQSAQPVEYQAKENNFQWAFTELHAVKNAVTTHFPSFPHYTKINCTHITPLSWQLSAHLAQLIFQLLENGMFEKAVCRKSWGVFKSCTLKIWGFKLPTKWILNLPFQLANSSITIWGITQHTQNKDKANGQKCLDMAQCNRR